MDEWNLTPQQQKKIYRKLVLDADKWKEQAEHLLHAASFLEDEVKLIYKQIGPNSLHSDAPLDEALHRNTTADVFFMLVGYAIENILKGILVRKLTFGQKKSLIAEPKFKLPGDLKTHKMETLASNAKIKLTSLERDLLNRMEQIVVWRGRYQAPIQSQDLQIFYRRSNDLDVLGKFLDKISK